MRRLVCGLNINQRRYELSRKVPLVVLVILLHVLVQRGSDCRQGFFSASADSSMQAVADEHMMENILFYCGVNRNDVGEVIKSLDYSLLWDTKKNSSEMHLNGSNFTKSSLQEAISLLSPEIEDCLIDFLKKQNLPLVSGKENHLKGGYHLYLESLLGWVHTLRRYLANQPSQSTAPTLSLRPSATPALAPGPAYASALSPDSGVEPPIPSPPPSSIAPPPFLLSSDDNSSAPAPDMFSPLFSDNTNSDTSPDIPPKEQSNNTKVVAIAVVLSILGTSMVAAFLYVFYKKCLQHRGYSRYSIRADRPLLSMSMSDFPGSSQKSFGMNNSYEKSNLRPSSFKTEPVKTGYNSSLNVDSTEVPDSKFLSSALGSSAEQFGKPTEAPAPRTPPPPPPIMAPPVPKTAPPPPVPPPPPPTKKSGAAPPPIPKAVFPPPRPPQANPNSSRLPRPLPSGGNTVTGDDGDLNPDTNAPKTKLKPFFWDKVVANPDHSMVWDQIKSGSFQFNEEMIESLFGYAPANKPKNEDKEMSSKSPPQYIRIIEPKKSQNLAISLKALNAKIEEVCHAIMEGGELPLELLQSLLKMPPTTDEELKLRLYTGNLSELGPVQQFLKTLVDIPFAYQRLDVLLFMASLPEEFLNAKESLATIEAACEELKSNRLFLKLLEAVLKTGNRMNNGTFRGGAQAFKLDTLLKLADVKGTDGKTTLLHFVVQEIIRSEGVRAVRVAREQSGSISGLTSNDFAEDSPHESEDYFRKVGLKVVSGLGDELENVKKAAGLDADALTGTVASLGHRLLKTKDFLNTTMKSSEEESGFHLSLKNFVEQAPDITSLLEEEKRIRLLVKKTTDFFHGKEGKDEGLRLFVIVKNFIGMLEKTCKEVRENSRNVTKAPRGKEAPSPSASPARDPRELLFPAIRDRRTDSSSSDDEG